MLVVVLVVVVGTSPIIVVSTQLLIVEAHPSLVLAALHLVLIAVVRNGRLQLVGALLQRGDALVVKVGHLLYFVALALKLSHAVAEVLCSLKTALILIQVSIYLLS